MFPKALVQHAIDCEVCIYRRHCTVQPHLTFLQLFGSNFRKMESKTDYFKSSRQSNKNSAFYKLMNVLCHAVSAVVAGYLSLLCSSSPSFYDSDTSPGSWLQTALLLTYWLWFFAIGRLFWGPFFAVIRLSQQEQPFGEESAYRESIDHDSFDVDSMLEMDERCTE